MTVKVVFFGSIGVAKRILDEIILTRNVDLLGVCCEKTINGWRSEESVFQYAVRKNIPVIHLEEIPDLKPDLGISVRYNKIIKTEIISSFRLGIVNTHGGILPEYRGSYCNINALINGESEYGVTLHYIQAGIDDGDIVDIKKAPIFEHSTGIDLYRESERLCYEIIEDNIDKLITESNTRVPQTDYISHGHFCNSYRRNETMMAKDLTDIAINDPLWLRTVRAFDSPYHEPAFIRLGDEKVYVRYKFGQE